MGLVAKGRVGGVLRGGYYTGSSSDIWQGDKADERLTTDELLGLAGPGSEITLTVVPKSSAVRIGVDRDSDGFFDHDEVIAGTHPADPDSP